jgi:hypothetical protein
MEPGRLAEVHDKRKQRQSYGTIQPDKTRDRAGRRRRATAAHGRRRHGRGGRVRGIEAGNADEAVSVLEGRTHIRIVMTDIDMPGSCNGLKIDGGPLPSARANRRRASRVLSGQCHGCRSRPLEARVRRSRTHRPDVREPGRQRRIELEAQNGLISILDDLPEHVPPTE